MERAQRWDACCVEGADYSCICMPNYICFKLCLTDSKDDQNNKILIFPPKDPEAQRRALHVGLLWPGRATWPECSSSSYPSNAGHRGLCGAAGPLASPPCSTILLVVSGSWTVVSCLLVRRSEVRKTYVTILVTLLPFSQQHVTQLISFLSLKCYLHWHLRCHTPNHSYL